MKSVRSTCPNDRNMRSYICGKRTLKVLICQGMLTCKLLEDDSYCLVDHKQALV